jgi:hypothetical protein
MKFNSKVFSAIIAVGLTYAACTTASAQQVNDRDLKKNVAPVANSISYISRLNPVTFEYNKEDYRQLNLPAGKQFGFIADDVKQVVPTAVSQQSSWYTAGKNSQRAITTSQTDSEKLVPLLVAAVKEQQAEIEKLKAELQDLKAKK